jgi:hypothetical protein
MKQASVSSADPVGPRRELISLEYATALDLAEWAPA